MKITQYTRDILLEVARQKKIFVEGNFLKLLEAEDGDTELLNTYSSVKIKISPLEERDWRSPSKYNLRIKLWKKQMREMQP
jgi:hypothetical protein